MTTLKLGLPDGSALRMRLNAHQLVTIPHMNGGAIEALGGQLWITVDGLTNDRVLAPGERFALQGRGLTVIEAVNDAEFVLIAPQAAPQSLLTTLWRAFSGVRSRFMHRWSRLARIEPATIDAACHDSASAALRCWRTLRGEVTALNLGLERTF
jgi:hypothetical protein